MYTRSCVCMQRLEVDVGCPHLSLLTLCFSVRNGFLLNLKLTDWSKLARCWALGISLFPLSPRTRIIAHAPFFNVYWRSKFRSSRLCKYFVDWAPSTACTFFFYVWSVFFSQRKCLLLLNTHWWLVMESCPSQSWDHTPPTEIAFKRAGLISNCGYYCLLGTF